MFENAVIGDLGNLNGDVSWSGRNGEDGGRMFFKSETDQPIYLIRPNLPLSVEIGDVIEKYGEPTHVIANAERLSPAFQAGRRLTLVFQSSGFALDIYPIPEILSPETIARNIIFFTPTQAGFEQAILVPKEYISPWQGYKPYAFYCFDIEQGKACREER